MALSVPMGSTRGGMLVQRRLGEDVEYGLMQLTKKERESEQKLRHAQLDVRHGVKAAKRSRDMYRHAQV